MADAGEGAKQGRHINTLIAKRLSRRGVLSGLAGLPLLTLAACATDAATSAKALALPAPRVPGFTAVPANTADVVTAPAGYEVRTLIGWGDPLFDGDAPAVDRNAITRAEQERRFGDNNDMLAMFPATWAFPTPTDQRRHLLCVNHEYSNGDLLFPQLARQFVFSSQQWGVTLSAIGITVVQVEHLADGSWRVIRDAAPGKGLNRRITPFTPVVFDGPAKAHRWIAAGATAFNTQEPHAVAGAVSCGTLANCAGGQTPWGTYLSSEENFDFAFFVSDRTAPALARARTDAALALDAANFGYALFDGFPRPGAPRQFDLSTNPHGATLYGWTVEVDPYDPAWTPRKRTALGRRKGECATTALARDGRVAVYSGDDQRNEYLYKFVSKGRFNPADRLSNRDLLGEGRLHVARFDEDGAGVWLELTVDAANAAAREAGYPVSFTDHGDVMMRARDAARLMGATPMDRPEDVEALRDASWRGLGPVLVACTNNSEQGFARPGNPRRADASGRERAQANHTGHIVRIDEADGDAGATRFTWDVFALAGDPAASTPTAAMRSGSQTHVAVDAGAGPTFSGDRFACPDNIFIDSAFNVWIATDGSDAVFADCNDAVLVTPAAAEGPRPVKRFLVAPVGAEMCGPMLSPDESTFFAAIQHPGESDVAGLTFSELRWTRGAKSPPSTFAHNGDGWPRSSVVYVTRKDGGKIVA